MKKLMLALSNISFSSSSVSYALDKVEKEGCELIVVFVLDEEIPESVSSLLMYIGFMGLKPANDLKTTLLEEYKKRGYSELKRVEELSKEKNIKMKKLLREGRFVDEILKVQEEEKTELIVTSRPKGSLLPKVLSSYNLQELKRKLDDKLIIIEEQ
jgi:hypothetical protein